MGRARPCGRVELSNSLLLDPGEDLRLGKVGRHDGGEREEPLDQRLDRVVLEQLRARARDHHRVDDQWYRPLLEKVGGRLDQTRRGQHPRLRRVDADVVEHRLELRGHELLRQLVDRRHADRVLRGQRDKGGHAVAAGRGKRLQVGLDPGAPARVGGSDRQTTWRQNSPFAGITRIRFAGLISALGRAPRYDNPTPAQDLYEISYAGPRTIIESRCNVTGPES